jgi:hypothetical protein
MKFKLIPSTAALALIGLVSPSALSAADDAPAARPSREEMMKRFDANQDGKLDQTEREAMRAAAMDRAGGPRGERDGQRGPEGRGGPGGPGGNRMKEFDTDGDGKISATERTAAESAMRANISSNPRAMARIDTDKDGKISDTEWAAAREAMGDRGPRGPGPGPGAGKGKGRPESN